MDLEPVPGTLGVRWKNLPWIGWESIAGHHAHTSFTPKGNLALPIHLQAYFWKVRGNPERKLTHANSNSSTGLN